ncbi:proline-rich receptor-like protein kinase PERK10 [Spinacia oleracea]|uniref:Proline-rich receptor-like protein kinase PERK10 n=1 Tax=Spinacia oleracea TaxID=3562 RepID=A0ABM3QQ29_SPIOL|nr:proline-rich receptor-like protein kinase PERK10 [Spinacia oleracea]
MDTMNEEARITPPPPRPESLSERCQQVTSSPPPQHKVTPPLPSPKVPPPQPKVTSPLRPPSLPKVTSPLPPPSPPKVTSPLPPPSPPKVISPLPPPSPPKVTSPLPPTSLPKVTSPLPPPSPPKVTFPLPPPSPPKVTTPLPPPSPPKVTSPLPPTSPPKVTSPLPPPSPPKVTAPLPPPSPPKVTSPLPHPSPPKVTSPLPHPSPPQFTLPRSPQLCVDPIGGANMEAVVSELMASPLPGSLDRERGKDIVCGLSVVSPGDDIECDNKMDGLLASSALLFQRSRPRRGRKKRVALADRGRGWFTSEIKKFSYNLVEFVNHNGGLLSGRGNLKGLSLNVMIKCGDGSNCNMHQCKAVAQLNGCVHKQYVDTVAKLYNSMWAGKYLGRSMRYMLTSVFSEKVMKFAADCRDGVHNSAVDRSRLANWMSKEREKMKVASHLGEEDQHTETGTVFSRISELIGVDKLLFGGEDGDGWGELLSWERRRMDIDIQKDTHSCGVRMLLAIKDFAKGYESLRITDLEEARRLLLTQDILSPFNLERDRIKELVNGANRKKL